MTRERSLRMARLLGGAALLLVTVGATVAAMPTRVQSGGSAPAAAPTYAIVDAVTGLEAPRSLGWLPDGRLLVSESGGAIRVVRGGILQPEPWAELPSPLVDRDAGLMGMAVDLDYPTQPYVYVYYQHQAAPGEPGPSDVLVRLREVDGRGVVDRVLIDALRTPDAERIGGVVHMEADRTLYVTTAIVDVPESRDRRGVVLRMTRDGAAAPGNPVIDGLDPRVYAYGLRDPGDFDWDRNGQLLVTDRDPQGRGTVHPVLPGQDQQRASMTAAPEPDDPTPSTLSDAGALAGLEAAGGVAQPGGPSDVFVCSIPDGTLHRLWVDGDRIPGERLSKDIVARSCTGDLATGPDGRLYFVDTGAGRVRVVLPDAPSTEARP